MTRPKKPVVGIIMGSSSDAPVMGAAAQILDEFGIYHEDQIVSAHRTPDRIAKYAKHAEDIGLEVIIAGAGGAAHLPGMVASHTIIPVIGVPILVYNYKPKQKPHKTSGSKTAYSTIPEKISAFEGLDSLLSITEMPSGSPVVSVGVNKAANAGIYAAKILATRSVSLAKKLVKSKSNRHKSVLAESAKLQHKGLSRFVSEMG